MKDSPHLFNTVSWEENPYQDQIREIQNAIGQILDGGTDQPNQMQVVLDALKGFEASLLEELTPIPECLIFYHPETYLQEKETALRDPRTYLVFHFPKSIGAFESLMQVLPESSHPKVCEEMIHGIFLHARIEHIINKLNEDKNKDFKLNPILNKILCNNGIQALIKDNFQDQ